jgi:hypothetical protein
MERRWSEVLLAAAAVALLVSAFLLPGWESFHRLLTGKPGVAAFVPATWTGLAMLIAGSAVPWLAWMAWAFIVRGCLIAARRQPLLARFGATLVLAQFLAVLVIAPRGAGASAIFLRYNIVSLVLLLAALGVGLATPPSAPWLRRAWSGVGVLFLLTFCATHPLRDGAILTRGFGLSAEFLSFHQDPAPWTLGRPAPYAWLESQGEGSVVESPVRLFPTDFVRPLRAWARRHGRRVRVVPHHAALRDPRLGLRSVVAFGAAELLRSGARFVIVHPDLERWIEPGAFSGANGELKRRRAEQIRRLGMAQSRRLRRAYGPPDSAGDGVEIWDLERLRDRER